jgi:ATP-dependent RNA helicase DeaD
MDSFEDLGLSPELVESLAAEGIESPTSLQEAAIPVVRRGHNLLIAAAPGSGTLVSWGSAVLDALEDDSATPAVLVLTPTVEGAERMAESLQRMAATGGHSVAAMGTPWAFPTRANILFGTPVDVMARVRGGDLALAGVRTLVVDQADRIERLEGLDTVEALLEWVPKDCQRVVLALPLTPAVTSFVERHARRAVTVPPRTADGRDGGSPDRGTIRFRVVTEPKEAPLLAAVAELLEDEARHVLVYFRSDDRAADVGDYLTMHGYAAGAPGDPTVPVWLGVAELESRSAAEGVEDVVAVSHDVPADRDSLDRRHGHGTSGVVLALPREMTHLRDIARRTGYKLQGFAPPRADPGDAAAFRELLAKAVEDEDVAPYLLLLEPLFERFDPAEVAAAAAALLRRKTAPPSATPSPAAREHAPTPWVRLFLSVGGKEGLTPKDLLGAITGETGIPGSKVGKIDIRDSHTLVEVEEPVAAKVITALNGTSIRGRAVRADYDRQRERAASPRGRRPGPRRAPDS